MNIIFAARADMDSQKWLATLRQAMPEANVFSLDESTGNADYAVVWAPPAELFQRELGLKCIFNLGAGVDALVKLPELPKNVPLVRMEDGGMAAQMAEYVLYFIIQSARNFRLYEQQQRQSVWHHLPSIERKQWRVGIMGAGAIGARVAKACAALDYPTAIWSRSQKDIPGIKSYAGAEELDEFLANTRVLVNVLPLTDATRGILSQKVFAKLLPHAMLINMARGGHLVEQDLLNSLDAGQLDRAVLDVFAVEPLPAKHPFWQHEKITITPHAAGASLLDETVTQIADKIRALEKGQTITGVVDMSKQY